MERTLSYNPDRIERLFRLALWLAIVTIIYNVLEGSVSVYFGFEDESLALFGFGIDSFIEVMSGIGIAHMVIRIRMHPSKNRDGFEKTALRITGTSFFMLVVGLIITSGYNIMTNHQPLTTQWGIVVSLISILVMWSLIYGKTRVGKRLESDAILADAQCTRLCIYMSLVLLLSSAVYELFQVPYIDVAGSLGLAYFSYKEGKECFEKANSSKLSGCDC